LFDIDPNYLWNPKAPGDQKDPYNARQIVSNINNLLSLLFRLGSLDVKILFGVYGLGR